MKADEAKNGIDRHGPTEGDIMYKIQIKDIDAFYDSKSSESDSNSVDSDSNSREDIKTTKPSQIKNSSEIGKSPAKEFEESSPTKTSTKNLKNIFKEQKTVDKDQLLVRRDTNAQDQDNIAQGLFVLKKLKEDAEINLGIKKCDISLIPPTLLEQKPAPVAMAPSSISPPLLTNDQLGQLMSVMNERFNQMQNHLDTKVDSFVE